jgi:hypothetical protein
VYHKAEHTKVVTLRGHTSYGQCYCVLLGCAVLVQAMCWWAQARCRSGRETTLTALTGDAVVGVNRVLYDCCPEGDVGRRCRTDTVRTVSSELCCSVSAVLCDVAAMTMHSPRPARDAIYLACRTRTCRAERTPQRRAVDRDQSRVRAFSVAWAGRGSLCCVKCATYLV